MSELFLQHGNIRGTAMAQNLESVREKIDEIKLHLKKKTLAQKKRAP